MVPAAKFYAVLNAAQDIKLGTNSNIIKEKLAQSEEVVIGCRSGKEGHHPFVDKFINTRGDRDNQGTNNSGLAIFKNDRYVKNLEKLLESKELDECFDYNSTDGQKFKMMFQCLKEKDNRNISQVNFNKSKLNQTSAISHPNT